VMGFNPLDFVPEAIAHQLNQHRENHRQGCYITNFYNGAKIQAVLPWIHQLHIVSLPQLYILRKSLC
jgi:hypothetical protein